MRDSVTRLSKTLCLLVLCMLCMLTGCASYKTQRLYNSTLKSYFLGPFDDLAAKPKTEVATLHIKNTPAYADRVDGKNLAARQFWSKGMVAAGRLSEVEMLPGEHSVDVHYSKCISIVGNTQTYLVSQKPQKLNFLAEAGRIYRVNAIEQGQQSWAAVIEDITVSETNAVLVAPKGGKTDFERKLEETISSGEINAEAITVTYPNGTKRTIPGQTQK